MNTNSKRFTRLVNLLNEQGFTLETLSSGREKQHYSICYKGKQLSGATNLPLDQVEDWITFWHRAVTLVEELLGYLTAPKDYGEGRLSHPVLIDDRFFSQRHLALRNQYVCVERK